jgi:hypothetical protein
MLIASGTSGAATSPCTTRATISAPGSAVLVTAPASSNRLSAGYSELLCRTTPVVCSTRLRSS